MFDAYLNTVNSNIQMNEALKRRQADFMNVHTMGYKQRNQRFADSLYGTILEDEPIKHGDIPQPIFMKGEKLTKIAIDTKFPNVFFLVRKPDGQELVTRLGDFRMTRQVRADNTYIGKKNEERVYLTTQDGYSVMGYAVGKGPLKQDARFRDPFSEANYPRLGESPIKTSEKVINPNESMQTGPLVPIDLTRGSNGLILNKYTEAKADKDGYIRGFRDGIWVPLYRINLVSIRNTDGLSQVDNTAYFKETEDSGLHTDAPRSVTILPEAIEKSNVQIRLTAFDYKRIRQGLNISLALQRSNQQLMSQFIQLLSS